MEDIDGGLHPAVDGQSLDEMRCTGTQKSAPELCKDKRTVHLSECIRNCRNLEPTEMVVSV